MRRLYLVRHGQASFEADDYDALSVTGHEQARLLGRVLAERGVAPDLVVRGDLRRHAETADGLLEGLGRSGAVAVCEDRGWNEFDFDHVVRAARPDFTSRTALLAELAAAGDARAGYQRVFEEATQRWSGGAFAEEYDEPFAAFVERVRVALHAAAGAQPEHGTVLVVSSGGPIGVVASLALAGDATLWGTLNRVAVNTGVTKLLHGGRGLSLLTYNDHSHVEHDRRLLTYR
ncbi:histidine phosphatase family protein [Nocardioides sp. zg-ZUI104]|uniref:histidine phosphatase family protein n=1 Tax=Nocardioides faecalis TaxID=2803858 RepID=UPI001BCCA34B|nr:histidine phosphatase family protein [Nocardioides faecalis]MBS4752498.1 histidine phosphatase family protein [Nocardioides faecalis]